MNARVDPVGLAPAARHKGMPAAVNHALFFKVTDHTEGRVILEDSRHPPNAITLVRGSDYLVQFYASPRLYAGIERTPEKDWRAVCFIESSLQSHPFRILTPDQTTLKFPSAINTRANKIILVAETKIRPERVMRDFIAACSSLGPSALPEPCATLKAYMPHRFSVSTSLIPVIIAPR
jgi:hypothetical protein